MPATADFSGAPPIAPSFVCTVCQIMHPWGELRAANDPIFWVGHYHWQEIVLLCGDCKRKYDPKNKCSLCLKNPTAHYETHLYDSDDDYGVDWYPDCRSGEGYAVRTMCLQWPQCAKPLERMRLRLLRTGFWYWVETNAMRAESRRIKRARRGQVNDPLCQCA